MQRQRDELWDCLDDLFGPTRTRPEQSRRGKCVRELRYAGITVEEVRVTYSYCSRKFPSFTEMALLNHLSAALRDAERPSVQDAIDAILGGSREAS